MADLGAHVSIRALRGLGYMAVLTPESDSLPDCEET
jgi:hypothetical protein